jgi:hypothetical protein
LQKNIFSNLKIIPIILFIYYFPFKNYSNNSFYILFSPYICHIMPKYIYKYSYYISILLVFLNNMANCGNGVKLEKNIFSNYCIIPIIGIILFIYIFSNSKIIGIILFIYIFYNLRIIGINLFIYYFPLIFAILCQNIFINIMISLVFYWCFWIIWQIVGTESNCRKKIIPIILFIYIFIFSYFLQS